ncbi:hypothetical protein NQ314_018418 [Rhamnusium bicolor]|uniref:MADF domain-containing protein n=1 Tax=Rhamnusium bicolor TaxID=1586634 RepID=A0AAV8WR15_9CUCU|nr:hypothetical protein NQ314_018418 [Rhamnusium bicolor]
MAFKWSAENCLNLITNYRQYPCIWDPKNIKYKCRESKSDAWDAVVLAVGCQSVEEAKRKIRNLIAQFYRERKKLRDMKKSGAGAHFHSKWFAYDALLFLRDKNKVRPCKEGGAENMDDPTYSSPESDVEDLSQMANSDQSEIEETQEL